MPEAEKNHFDAPMKSKLPQIDLRWPALTARGAEMARERLSVPRIALVASTAVNSDSIVPMPSTNAKPLTPAVARMKRMNAVMIVTTFALTIAVRPFL